MTETENPGPAVARRRVATELRRLRVEAGLTQTEVSEAAEMSPSKIIRIEGAAVGISASDLKALLDLYRLHDPDEVAELRALAKRGRERTQASRYRDAASRPLQQFIDFEAAASVTKNFQPLSVPGLLQTREYARLMLTQLNRGEPDKPVDIDALVEVRMKRQELLDRENPPELLCVLDEAVIRRSVGGRGAMRRQLLHLTDLAVRPRITIEIVPFEAGAHPGLRGSFVIHEFPSPDDGDVLYTEGQEEEQIKSAEPGLTKRYQDMFSELRRLSLGAEASLAFLRQVADTLA